MERQSTAHTQQRVGVNSCAGPTNVHAGVYLSFPIVDCPQPTNLSVPIALEHANNLQGDACYVNMVQPAVLVSHWPYLQRVALQNQDAAEGVAGRHKATGRVGHSLVHDPAVNNAAPHRLATPPTRVAVRVGSLK